MSDRVSIAAARREFVVASYLSAEKTNRLKYLSGDVRGTSEYIYENQKMDACAIVSEFYENRRRVVTITKKTKVGMDGLMIELAKLMATHSDDDFVVNPDNLRIITGMSNASWEKDMKDNAPSFLKDKIFHHGKLSKSDLKNLKNGFIIIDEIDTGDKEGQVLCNTLKEAGVLNINYMEENNIRFVLCSATPIRELYDLYRWGDLHAIYKMTIPHEYIGHSEFLQREIIKEFYPMKTIEKAEEWIQEDILDNYGHDFRVSVVRVTPKTKDVMINACIKKNIGFHNHTSDERLTPEEIKTLFEEPLTKHIVLLVKGFFRRANLIPNKWKLRIGATHELYTSNPDYNVQIQGLPGRMSGYWRDAIEAGHKTGPYRTSIAAVENYEAVYNDPFGRNSYQCAGFKKKNGRVRDADPTMVHPRNIDGLDPIALPSVATARNNDEYDITDVYNTSVQVVDALKRIVRGNFAKYTLNAERSTIQYRGSTVPIYEYVSKEDFMNKDINSGIVKELTETQKTTARIMPVSVNGQVKWIGIFAKKFIIQQELAAGGN
jgi:hypothetical protein